MNPCCGSLSVLEFLVGRRGLDPGTLGLKEAFRWLRRVGLVEKSPGFEGNHVAACRSGFVVLEKYEACSEACQDSETPLATKSPVLP